MAARVQGKHQPLQWNIGGVQRWTGCLGSSPGEGIVDRIEVGAAMVIDHPFGVPRGAGGVVEGKWPATRPPAASRVRPRPQGDEPLVVELADQLPFPVEGSSMAITKGWLSMRERLSHHGAELPGPPAPPCSGRAGR